MGREMELRKIVQGAALIASLTMVGTVQAQVPEYVYQASRYMPQGESQDFATLAEAEAYIRVEPATPRGNAFLRKTKAFALSDGEALLQYEVPRRAYESYLGGYYDGHPTGNATDCYGLKCRSEEEMVAASMRAYPLSNSYTPVVRGAYLSPPFKMWGSDGRNANVIMNAVQYNGGPIPNERQVVATNAAGHTYIYRINRTDVYQCPELFSVVDNAFGESSRGTWPMICINGAQGSIRVRFKQRAPFCQVPSDRPGNPCAADFGNKEYRETDFSWDGFDFRRAYNSIADFPLSSGFGDNWAHTFSDRIMFDNSGNVTYWVRPDGYVERLYMVESGKQVYYSPNTPNLALTKPVKGARDPLDGVWKLSTPGQKATWFDAQGRVVRKQVAGTYVDLVYCAGSELGSDECPSQDLLRRATNSRGRVLEFAYTVLSGAAQEARLVSVKSDGAVSMLYRYDARGRLTAAWHNGVEGDGRRYLYGEAALLCRNASGATIAGCDPTKYPNYLTGVEDESAVRFASYSYDDKGRATISEHAGGAGRVTVEYVSPTQSKVTLASGAVKTFAYTSEQLKKLSAATVTGGAGTSTQSTQVGYDSRWRVAYNSVVGGARTDFGYAGPNQVSRKEGLSETGGATALTRTTQIDWNSTYNEPGEQRVLNGSGIAVTKGRWSYNDRGQPLVSTLVDPITNEERSTAVAYCEQSNVDAGQCPVVGQVTSVDGPRTDVVDVTKYEYYPADAAGCATAPATGCDYRKGDLWIVTDASGRSVEMLRYDSAGRLLSSRDVNGVVSDSEYSARGWLLATKIRGTDNSSEADDRITRFEYWPTGQIKKSTLPDGASLTYTYDAAQRLTDIADNDGNSVHYTLDNDGNRLKEDTKTSTGTLKRTLSRVYNSLGQLQANKDASQNATVLRYDGRGNQDRITDALGRITDQGYDSLNRLVRTLQDAGGLNVETKFEYDPLDRLTKVSDPKGLDTVYAYNGFGDQTRLTSPDTGITNYTYDAAGKVATKQDANDPEPHRYTYDALGRPKNVFYTAAGAADVEYDYDAVNSVCAAGETFAVGRVTAMRTDTTELKYCYDRFGHVVRKVQTVDGKSLAVRYAYTLGGQLNSMTYPDGVVVDYIRNARGRVREVGVTPVNGVREVLLTSATYEPFGPLVGWTYGNGRVLAYAYDQNYRVKRIYDPSPGGLSLFYGYNEIGEPTQIEDGMQSAILAKYDYDSLGRLTTTRDGPTGASLETYEYDAAGNRTSLLHAGVTDTYTYSAGSHRLESVAGIVRDYDAVGNTISVGGVAKEFSYNSRGQVSQFKSGGLVRKSYVYNARDQRVAVKEAGGSVTYSVYDELGRWAGDYYDSGESAQQVVLVGGVAVGVLSKGVMHYVQSDRLGTPRAVVDPSRNLSVWEWNIAGEAFGNSEPRQDPDLDGKSFFFDLRFPGQRHDRSSGLSHNYFRDYDSFSGRYAQSDPVGLFAGLNTYVYVKGRPLNSTDYYGLQDIYSTIDLDLTAEGGWEVNFGSVFDIDSPLDSGFYGSYGPSYGSNLGAGYGLGFVCREIEGESKNLDLNIGAFSPAFSFDDKGFNGVSITRGVGVGVSVSATKTWSFTVRDAVNYVNSFWK